jgi:alcohol dehydrogenase class IV
VEDRKQRAHRVLANFKGDDYVFGLGCFDRLGQLAESLGRRPLIIVDGLAEEWSVPVQEAIRAGFAASSVLLPRDFIPGAAPNAPSTDVLRLSRAIQQWKPDVVVVVGGGSSIDAAKAAVAYHTLSSIRSGLMDYFGVGQVSAMLEESRAQLLPVLAVQLASSSAAHLTKYSNVTYRDLGQKLLIVDEAIVPPKALFDYTMTRSMPPSFTADGGLDGVSHCLEVFFGAPDAMVDAVRPVCLLGIDLIVNQLHQACRDGDDLDARESLGLGTDLGGYAIMLGGTNGAHLTSFSLVDVLSHGRACAMMNPYYTVFFSPAIEGRVRDVANIYKGAGYMKSNTDRLKGRDLGLALAEAMQTVSESIGFPTRLADVPGFTDGHIERALKAAKSPKLASKLQNMPVPLSAETVDDYMGPVLEAARTGDFTLIKNMPA